MEGNCVAGGQGTGEGQCDLCCRQGATEARVQSPPLRAGITQLHTNYPNFPSSLRSIPYSTATASRPSWRSTKDVSIKRFTVRLATHTHTHTHKRARAHIHALVHTHTHSRKHARTYTHTHHHHHHHHEKQSSAASRWFP